MEILLYIFMWLMAPRGMLYLHAIGLVVFAILVVSQAK